MPERRTGGWRRAARRADPVLLACTAALTLIGIATIYGARDNFGEGKFRMQCAMAILGAAVTFLCAAADYRIVTERLWIPMLVFSVGILAVTLVAGDTGAGRETSNRSWLTIPVVRVAVQPSEFVKVTFICAFARHLTRAQGRINRIGTLLGLCAHALAVIGLILLSGDLGVALVYLAVALIMLYAAGLHPGYLVGGAAAAALAFPFLWDFLAGYQQDRILTGFRPELDPMGRGWQPLLSRRCIENGGLFGVGLRSGGDYERLAASHTDFILATVCEKFGFLGGLAVLAALVTMTLRILWIARRTGDGIGRYLCVGVAAVLMTQTAENVGMCLACLPTVGLTLPFLSCGGSSLLASFLLLGMVHSVWAYGPARASGG